MLFYNLLLYLYIINTFVVKQVLVFISYTASATIFFLDHLLSDFINLFNL